MQLTDQQLNYYIDDVLAFGREDKRKYQDQIDNLKAELTRTIAANSALRITKINQAGSWIKGTALKPRDGFDIDIDLVVYLDVSEAERSDIEKLHALMVQLLCKVYPTKSESDFKPSKKTVGIQFRTSGLKVDLVPVVPVKTLPDFVWQPEAGGGGSFITSPPKQLEFIRTLKDKDPRYASTVRLMKRWRNYAELGDAISSFAIELIVAHVIEARGVLPRLEEGVLRVLTYIAQSELKAPISFKGAIRNRPTTSAPVQIFDPTNNENNVTARISESDRRDIVRSATEALETLNWAQNIDRKGDTMDRWKEVFGPSFKVEE